MLQRDKRKTTAAVPNSEIVIHDPYDRLQHRPRKNQRLRLKNLDLWAIFSRLLWTKNETRMRVRTKCGVQGRGLGGVVHLIGGHAESQTHAPCGPPRASPWPPNRRTMHQTPHECHFRMPFLQQMLRQSLATNVASRRGPPATDSRQSWTNKGPGHTLSEYEPRPQMLRHTSTPIWVSSGGPRLTVFDHLLTAHSENCLQFW